MKLMLLIAFLSFPVFAHAAPLNFSWTDNSDNEDGFIFEARLAETGAWVELARTPADSTTYTLTDPEPYTGARVWAFVIDSWTSAEIRSTGAASNLRPDTPASATDLQPVATVTTTRATTTTVAYHTFELINP
jgi:hypothetical protein